MNAKQLKEILLNVPDDANVNISVCVVHQYCGDHDCDVSDFDNVTASFGDGKFTLCASETIDHREEDYGNNI